MSGFDPGTFLEDTKNFDVDGFLADTDPEVFETGGPNQVDDVIGPPIDTEEIGRVRGTVGQRAANALRRMQAGSAMAPDDADALLQALRGDYGQSEPVSALEAANLHGGNAAMLGWGDELAGLIGGDGAKAAVRQRMTAAEHQHPGVSLASDIAGGVPTSMALPNGWLGSAAVGAAAGAGNAGSGLEQTAKGAAVGAGTGLAAKALTEYGPAAAKQLLERGKIATGGAFKLPEALRRIVAGEQAPTSASSAPNIATLEEQLADAAAANQPRPAPAAAPTWSTIDQMPQGGQIDEAIRQTNQHAAENIPGAVDVQARHQPNVDLDATYEVLRRVRQIDAAANGAKTAQAAQEPTLTQVGLEQLPDTANKRAGTPPAADTQPAMPWETPTGADWKAYPRAREVESEMAAARARQGWDVDSRVAPVPNVETPPAGTAAAPPPVAATTDSLAAKRQRIIDAQQANPEALAAFGVDPKKGERGFGSLELLEMMGGYGLGKQGARAVAQSGPAKAAGGALADVGSTLQRSGKEGLSPDAIARSWTSNPQVLFHLSQSSGALGHAARTILQALTEGDDATVKAQTALLGMNPEFRALFASGTAGQGPTAPTSSAQ